MDPVRFTNGPRQPSPGTSPAAATRRDHPAGMAPMVPDTTAADATRTKTVAAAQHDAVSANSATQPTAPELRELLERTGDHIDPARRSLSFEIREELGRAVVSVYDADTEELVRRIPADEMIRVASVMREIAEQGEQRAAAGLLLNEQA